jgi:hypothetical protein
VNVSAWQQLLTGPLPDRWGLAHPEHVLTHRLDESRHKALCRDERQGARKPGSKYYIDKRTPILECGDREYMPSLIAGLSKREQLSFLEDLNYLNMGEIKLFCKKHFIPYSIWIEAIDGGRRKTRDDDRKGVILNRIRHYLETGEVLAATCFPPNVVCFDECPKNLTPTEKLFYGQYDKKSNVMVGLLEKLTGGQFKNGAIARMIAREFWTKGIAPTFEEYALAWLEAKRNYKRPNPEWAFLSDRAQRKDTSRWKHLRTMKAKYVLSFLMKLEASPR